MDIRLENVLEYEQPTKYIVKSENYSDDFALPVLTAGKSFVLGFTDETDGICKASESPVIIFDDFTADCKYVDFDFKVKSSAMKILHKANTEDNLKYYFYAMQAIDYTPFSHKRVWISEYSKFKIKNRSIAEQNNIVKELDTVATAIDNAKQRLNALDELVKSRFIEMFGDIRISSIFPNIALENFAQIGSSKRVHAADYVESGVPFYRSKEIIELGNGQEPSVELFISKKQYESIKKTNGVPCKGDILMSAVGTIGKMWIVDGRKDFYYKDGNIISIHSEETNPIYLKEALANLIDDFKSANVAGSAYSALTIVKLKKMTVPMPPMSIQNEFADFVKLIDKSKFIVQKQIDDLQELLDSKMDEYFGYQPKERSNL